jgi:hypothetical protein
LLKLYEVCVSSVCLRAARRRPATAAPAHILPAPAPPVNHILRRAFKYVAASRGGLGIEPMNQSLRRSAMRKLVTAARLFATLWRQSKSTL